MPHSWQCDLINTWLLEEGRMDQDLEVLTRRLGDRLLESGAPVSRLRISMRTLHPLVAAFSTLWERETRGVEAIEEPHGLENRKDYLGSPLYIVSRTGRRFRKRIEHGLSSSDSDILHELLARGATDYLGLPAWFSDGRMAILSVVTDSQGGFSDHDIEQFERMTPVLGPIVEVFNVRRTSRSIAEAYLGPRTGPLVLDGRITRGDVEKIEAAIMMSDIRDWSGMNNRMPVEETVALANACFELLAGAIEQNGGEILKFIGDAVLAIFPVEATKFTPREACDNALRAAQQALSLSASSHFQHNLEFGLGLHFGEVLYGNIGSPKRLDFTVLGQAVNIASRIEGLCAQLERSLLFSEDFANLLDVSAEKVAETDLKGHDGMFRIYSTGPEGVS